MALRDNLVSWWELNETSGTRYDAHGSNDLTDNNTVLYAAGKQGNGADFEDANSEYLSISDASQTGLDITGDLSFSCWIKPETTPSGGAGMAMMYKWAGGSASYGLIYIDVAGTKKIRLNIYQDGSNNIPFDWTVGSLSTTSFTHIVVRFDVLGHPSGTGTAELFVNGTSVGTVTNGSASSIYSGTGAFSISSLSSGIQWYWDGVIDEAGIWSKKLSDTEVSDLYNSGNGLNYAGTAPASTFIPRISFIM